MKWGIRGQKGPYHVLFYDIHLSIRCHSLRRCAHRLEDNEESHVARWAILGLSAVVGVTGGVLAVIGNSKAKNAAETLFFADQEEFEKKTE